MGRKFKDITGQRFGRLIAVKYFGKSKWRCKCDCGNIVNIDGRDLRCGSTKSCGCLQKEIVSNIITKQSTKHGKSGTRLYNIYNGMKDRCYNKNDKDYYNYGGRTITMCNDWKNDFKVFYDWSMSNGYNDSLSIDRIDVNGNYEPNNCRWVNMKIQQRNRRNNKEYTINGETHCLSEWCEILNLKYDTVYHRLTKLNWTIEKALEVN